MSVLENEAVSPIGFEAARELLRPQMPITERWAYFDHAAVAPIPASAREAADTYSHEAATEGDTVWPTWRDRYERVRPLAAQMIGSTTDEIAFISSTSEGISLVAEGIRWQPGDNVVILANEYPSNVYPWMNQKDRGVEVRQVETDYGRLDLDKLRAACDQNTRLVSFTWVGFNTGYRYDLGAISQIAHDVGARFFLDAIQGLGYLPLDVDKYGIDFLAADGHKWMLGPEGAGFAYIRQSRIDELRPHSVGWKSVVKDYDFENLNFDLKPNAGRFERGSANMVGVAAFGASLDLLLSLHPSDREASVLDITDYACEKLQEAGAKILSLRQIEPSGHDPRSGIVIMEPPGESPTEFRSRCLEAGIALNCRGGGVRLSPHVYNTYDEIDRLIEVLQSKPG